MKSTLSLLLAALVCISLNVEGAPAPAQWPGPEGHAEGHPAGHPAEASHHEETPHPSVRTPSMSRSMFPRANALAPQTRPATANRTQVRQQLGQYLQRLNHPQGQPQRMNPALQQQRQAFQQASRNSANLIRQNHPNYGNWFNQNSFQQHRYFPHYWHQGANWWGTPAWAGVAAWVGSQWTAPVYYGGDGNPYEVVDNPPAQPYPASVGVGGWLPLGVFAAGQNPAQAAYSNMFVQLAVDREGDLDGTYYNAGVENYAPLEGYLDPASQQAVWRLADNEDSPVMTTDVYSLTQSQANVQVHFPDGTTQSWVLIRVSPPT